ncbi:MAG: S1 RNA-binding domain-containing protein [Anaerolineae bacterium]|nr:S1 RNA-binding domain-containing protein [Anaerolineae bacterium]
MSVELETKQVEEVKPKTQYTGKVLKVSLAGAVVEFDEGKRGVLHISQMIDSSGSQDIRNVEDILKVGEDVSVWVRKVKDSIIELTMLKPLDLEWRDLKKGLVVKGTVVRLEKFGAFVEIGAERPGLVHISEMSHSYVKTPGDVVKEGDEIEAEVLDFNRKKKQIKLSMKALQPEPVVEEPPAKSFEPASQTPREKAPKRPKKVRKSRNATEDAVELLASMDGSQAEAEAEPTAMEIAIRAAMDRAKERKQQEEKNRKGKNVSKEQEDLLTRTLNNKVQTA